MKIKVDSWTIKARFLPLILALLPIWYTFEVLGYDFNLKPFFIVGIFVYVFLVLALSFFSSVKGNKLEGKLWTEWGGPLATQFLMRSNTHLDPNVKKQYHNALTLQIKDLVFPELEEELKDIKLAKRVYNRCVVHIKQHTKDKEKYPIIFSTLANYGFRRNLLAFKTLSVSLLIVLLIAGIAGLLYEFSFSHLIDFKILSLIIAYIVEIIAYSVFINSDWVKTTALTYAERLLETLI